MITEKHIRLRARTLKSSMTQRFGPKYKGPLLLDPGQPLPFTLDELYDWLMANYGFQAFPCPYCRCPLDVLNMTLDHKEPVSRGGSLRLSNLQGCCDSCNRVKGDLTHDEFMELVSMKRRWHPVAAGLLDKRLKDGLTLNAERVKRWAAKSNIQRRQLAG